MSVDPILKQVKKGLPIIILSTKASKSACEQAGGYASLRTTLIGSRLVGPSRWNKKLLFYN